MFTCKEATRGGRVMRWGLPLLLKQQAPGAGLFLLVSNWVGGGCPPCLRHSVNIIQRQRAINGGLVYSRSKGAGFPGGTSGEEPASQCRRRGSDPWVRKIPWRRAWQPTPVFLPGESPRTEEPGRLQSTGLQGAGDN